jgi:hypothetical protein
VSDPSGYSGDGAVLASPNDGARNEIDAIDNSPRLDFYANFAESGTYDVCLRGLSNSNSDNSAHVGLDGQAVASAARMNFNPTGDWDWTCDTMDGVPAVIEVPTPGEHTLNLWMRESGLRVDRLLLTSDASYSPTGTGPAESDRLEFSTTGLLLKEDFAGGSLDGWTVVDEGDTGGRSSWSAASGALVQSSNIRGGSFEATTLLKPGTYALFNGGSGWTDYEATFSARSDDNDEFGVMFRVLDSNNYYRFSWNAQFGYRRLVKNVDGVFTLLAEEAIPYVPGQTYQVGVTVDADLIAVQIDDDEIFSVIDPSISKGSIAVYSWADAGVSFDDISVTGI